jgi:serine protease Do
MGNNLFLAGVIGISSVLALAEPPPARTSSPTLAQFSAAITGLAASASPSVVQITLKVRVPVEDNDDKRKAGFVVEQRSSGSGVIVDSSGYIVTNAHVVDGAQKIDVSVSVPGANGSPPRHGHYAAKVVGSDKNTDLALLEIPATGLPVIAFADSDRLEQGQMVLALGSPLGLENSLTVGFISAPHRHLNDQEPMYYVQTDAPINPGNSGGPLLDIEGRIVGINTLIFSRSGGSEGIGFAIPSNTVQRVWRQLRESGRIRRGALGVLSEDITPLLAKALSLDREQGVILTDVVPHSSADAAGLQPGDVLLTVDGKPVEAAHELIGTIFEHQVGDIVTIEAVRGGHKIQTKATVMERPRSPVGLAELASEDSTLIREIGVLALPVNEKVNAILPDLRRLSGVAVAAIPAEYAATNPGLLAGDVIYEINGKPVATVEALQSALASKKLGDAVALLIERDGRLVFVTFEVE